VAYLHTARRRGVEIDIAPADPTAHGAVDVDALASLIGPRTRLVAVTHVPTNGGLVNPAEQIGAVAADHEVPYLLDACQSMGQLDLDVSALRCDFLTATGRKYLRGPRGTGLLFVSDRMLAETEPAVLDHHGAAWTEPGRYEIRADARRYENWEFNHAAVLGLGTALDEAAAWGLPAIESRVVALAARLRDGLDTAGLPVHDLGTRRCGIVTTTVPGMAAADVQAMLHDQGIAVSVVAPESTFVDSVRRSLPALVRLSVHYYNTDDELDAAVAALAELARVG